MSDNVTLGSAAGTVAADELVDGTLGTVKVQYVKLMNGDLDSSKKYGDTNPIPTVIYDAAAPTTGTLTAADAASTVTSTGFNGASWVTGTPTAGSSVSFAFNGENAVAIQLLGTWVATVTLERSIDNGTTWHYATTLNTGNPYTSVTGNGLFYINAAGATNARVRIASGNYTSGTVNVSLYAATGIFPISVVNAQMGQYNATAPTLTTGSTGAFQTDVNGNQKQNLATRLDAVNDAVTSYDFGYSFTYISTATGTLVKTGAGVLKSIIVNGGTTGTIVANDNTAASGTTIFSFDTTNAIATYNFELAFTTGLYITTSAATKVTVIWR